MSFKIIHVALRGAGLLVGAVVVAVLIGLGSQRHANAQATPGLRLTPLGYCQLTSIDASTLISSCSGGIPVGTNYAILTPEAQAIRYRDDGGSTGTAPSAAVGMPLAVGTALAYQGTFTAMRVISQTSGAKLNILFYKSP